MVGFDHTSCNASQIISTNFSGAFVAQFCLAIFVLSSFPIAKSLALTGEDILGGMFNDCRQLSDTSSTNADHDYVRELIYQVAETVDIRPNFVICKIDSQAIAFATFRNNQGHFFYDAGTFQGMRLAGQQNWGAIAILAHELDHILRMQESPAEFQQKTTKQIELEADHFAGFVLGKMGASEQEAIYLFEHIGTIEPAETHGSRDERVESTRRGWIKAYVGLPFGHDLNPFLDYIKYYGLKTFHFVDRFLGFIATAGGAAAAISGLIVWLRRRKDRRRVS